MDLPQLSVELTVTLPKGGENRYTVEVPNIGTYMDIQIYKARLSNGSYQSMLYGGADGMYGANLLDMMACFKYLCPEMMKDLNVDSLTELGIIESKVLMDVFTNQFAEWWYGIIKFLNGNEDEESTKEETERGEEDGLGKSQSPQ